MTYSRDSEDPGPTRLTTTIFYDPESAEPVGTTLLNALGEIDGISPEERTRLLHDVIDPDSLDDIFASISEDTPPRNGRVAFTYLGYDITVEANGEITIAPGPRIHHPAEGAKEE